MHRAPGLLKLLLLFLPCRLRAYHLTRTLRSCMHCAGGFPDPVPRVHGDGVRKGGRPVQLRQGVRPSQRAGREVRKQPRDS